MSGLAASLAAVIYVAHLGQAKSDAGTGYELTAIAAVVLGGASIFGGRGTVLGTLLGLFAIVILQNGLRLSGQPSELAGVLTGVLLVATIMLDRLSRHTEASSRLKGISQEEFEVKNWQIGILSAVILAAALIVAGSNWLLVRSIKDEKDAAGPTQTQPAGVPTNTKKSVIAMMPKAKGDPYFISCKMGARRSRERVGCGIAVGRADRP